MRHYLDKAKSLSFRLAPSVFPRERCTRLFALTRQLTSLENCAQVYNITQLLQKSKLGRKEKRRGSGGRHTYPLQIEHNLFGIIPSNLQKSKATTFGDHDYNRHFCHILWRPKTRIKL